MIDIGSCSAPEASAEPIAGSGIASATTTNGLIARSHQVRSVCTCLMVWIRQTHAWSPPWSQVAVGETS